MKTDICSHCGEKIINPYKNCHGNLCRKCRCRYEWEKTLIRKIKVVELLGGKCSICGYDKYYGALHLHHQNPEEKEHSWKYLRTCSWDKMMKEIEKCILVCGNCHIELHAKPIGELQFAHKSQKEINQRNLKKRQNHKCESCGKLFTAPVWNSRQRFCSSVCSHKALRKVERPSLEVLAKEIKNSTWVNIGKKYGVSDNAVRKWAKGYGIILPDNS